MLSIVIPEKEPDTADLDGLVAQLHQCKTRQTLFCGESIRGYVVQSGTHEPVFLTVLYSGDEIVNSLARPVHVGSTDEETAVWRFETQISVDPVPGRAVIFSASAEPGDPNPEENSAESAPQSPTESLTLSLAPPVLMKIKLTKPGGRNDVLLTCLSVEASDFDKDATIVVHSLEVEFRAGKLEKLAGIDFPQRLAPADVLCATYKLVNNTYLDSQIKNTDLPAAQPLLVALKADVEKNGSVLAGPIVLTWLPVVDFGLVAPPILNLLKLSNNLSHVQTQSQFQLLLPLLNTPTARKQVFSSRKTSRMLPVPLGTQLASALVKMPKKLKPPLPLSLLAVTVNLGTSNSSLAGLRLTFQGKLNVQLGKIVSWRVQAINHANHTMHLSLIVKNPLNFNPVYSAAGSSLISSSNLVGSTGDSRIIAYSRPQLYHQYQQLKLETSGVVVLTNDIRLGPIDPNTVFESEFELIGISKGVFNLHGLKIFDMSTGDGIDFGKLVEVFVN